MFEPRAYQRDAINSIYDYYKSGKRGNPILALPTGTGKAVILALFLKEALEAWPTQRFLVLTHVKELVKQNASKLLEAWPEAPVGIHSAGLKSRDTKHPILFGGIASVRSKVQQIGHRDVLLIDECHLCSPNAETSYQKVIKELTDINPKLKILGLTATYYRMGLGLLTQGGIFTDIIYDITNVAGFNRMIQEGYLCPLIPKHTHTQLDVSNVSIRGGEFVQSELQAAVDKKDTTYKCLMELCQAGAERKSWLVFASGVDHAIKIADMLNSFGVPTAAVHAKLSGDVRDKIINNFKAGLLRCVVNNNILTTGFDHPPIDLIGMLRPTSSPSLWVQMAGRGTRTYPGKLNTLLLDFSGNTARLGPINDPRIPGKGKGTGDVPVRLCPACGVYNHAAATACIACGFPFPRGEKLSATASEAPLLKDDTPQISYFDINRVVYHAHPKPGAPTSLRVTYYSGTQHAFKEWVHVERDGLPGKKAREWWEQRCVAQNPTPGRLPFTTTEQALRMTHLLKQPKRIRVHTNKEYPEILGYEF